MLSSRRPHAHVRGGRKETEDRCIPKMDMQKCLTPRSVELTLSHEWRSLAPAHHVTVSCSGESVLAAALLSEGSYVPCSRLHSTAFPTNVPSRTCFSQYLHQPVFSKDIELIEYISTPTTFWEDVFQDLLIISSSPSTHASSYL